MNSFGINGKYLAEFTDIREILNPMIVLDKNFNERLIYGNTIGKLNILKLPYFTDQETKPCLEKSSAVPLAVTPDRRVLIYHNLGLCGMGDFISPVPAENKEAKGLIDFIRRK